MNKCYNLSIYYNKILSPNQISERLPKRGGLNGDPKKVQIYKLNKFKWQRSKPKFQMNVKWQMLKNICLPINSNTAYTGEYAQWEKDK